jgi:hypothetical protein
MSELRVRIVKRDPKGKIIDEKDHVTKIAVIMDLDEEISEIIKVDRVRIVAMLITETEEVFQTNFVLGGVDSTGFFHPSPGHGAAMFSVNRNQSEEFWKENLEGRTVFDFADILRWVHDDRAVSRAGRDIWKIEGLESFYEGEPEPEHPIELPPPPASETIPGVVPSLPFDYWNARLGQS